MKNIVRRITTITLGLSVVSFGTVAILEGTFIVLDACAGMLSKNRKGEI